jgi:hypothetical protein
MKLSLQHALLAATALGLSAPVTANHHEPMPDENGFVISQPGDELWQEIPGLAGVGYVKVYGDSKEPGVYVVRVRFPPWTMTMPHTHSQDRLVAVVKGTWYAGTDTKFDASRTTPIGVGGYMFHPANGVHFDGARADEVIVQITGMGPVSTTFLEPDLGPTRKIR